ncbi:hypothetical protein HYC85_013242 [Camellia sinensis]|uniref:Germin-like protein n=1 Tax=Camellia sinensis TaxID=4442 RepID=A0A7J7H449_CAMSI|nr:hypothetical protein HYC85_013242 [Camellia sinensis]
MGVKRCTGRWRFGGSEQRGQNWSPKVRIVVVYPRATEIFTVFEGTLEVGFVTSNLENHFISKVLQKGDVFVFPIGLIHYERNVGHGSAIAIVGLSSQNPGVITVANAVF